MKFQTLNRLERNTEKLLNVDGMISKPRMQVVRIADFAVYTECRVRLPQMAAACAVRPAQKVGLTNVSSHQSVCLALFGK